MSSTASTRQTSSSGNRTNLDDDFAKWMQDLLDEYHVLGASIAVVDNGNIESAGYGLARLPDVPATGDTIYRMASTSKAVGAAIMGLILEDDTKNTVIVDGKEEKLKWSTPIMKIIGDDFDLNDDDFNRNATIEDALSDRTGLSGHDSNFGPWMGKEKRTYVRSLRYIDAITAPNRTTFQYTNTMFGNTGYVIEKIEGKSFEEVAMDRIWKPLGMTSTFATLTSLLTSGDDHGDRLARGYWWCPGKETKVEAASDQDNIPEKGHYVAEAHLDIDLVGPAAAILSSANDYGKRIAKLLQASKLSQEDDTDTKTDTEQPKSNIISPKLIDQLTTSRTLVIPSGGIPSLGSPLSKYPNINPQLYALGWFTGPWVYTGQTIVHHPGGCQGFGAHVFLLPEHDFGLVVVENGGVGNSKIAELVGKEIIGKRIGVSREERRKKEIEETATVTEWDPRASVNDTLAQEEK